jgi:putative transposase
MPRAPRTIQAGLVYHVLNRGNGRMRLFLKDGDYAAFEKVLGEALDRYPADLLTYCLIPNHWHLVLRPKTDEALTNLMRWIGVTHVRRHHAHYQHQSGGHLYQGRFKCFPVQDDGYFLTLCRYVEANAVRAKLTADAREWPWAGAHARRHADKPFTLARWPLKRPRDWTDLLNHPMDKAALDQVRQCLIRGRPMGTARWTAATAARLGMESTLRSLGRPRKKENE